MIAIAAAAASYDLRTYQQSTYTILIKEIVHFIFLFLRL